MSKKLVITAGFDKSKVALCLAEILKRKGFDIVGILVVNPFNFDRLYKTTRAQGFQYVKNAIPKLLGRKQNNYSGTTILDDFFFQCNFAFRSLKKWSKTNDSNYKVVENINHTNSDKFLSENNPDYIVYAGGGIIRSNIIKSFRGRILNAHMGPLPEVRGMNAIEWSILLNTRNEITIHFIDEGIDTGDIINAYQVNIDSEDTIQEIREKALIAGINGIIDVLVKGDPVPKLRESGSSQHFRQCFTLSKTMTTLLEHRIRNLNKSATR